MRYTVKSIPPVLVSILAFLWSLRICNKYNIALGIILMVLYLFLVFFTNMLIPVSLKKIKTIHSIRKLSIYFFVMSFVMLLLAVVLRLTLSPNFTDSGKRNLDCILMLFFSLSCGHYSVFLALNDPNVKLQSDKEE